MILGGKAVSPVLTYKLADQASEFEAIHRLNYRTFVEEIPQHPANSARRLVDRFHDENTYSICLDGDNLVGMIAGRSQRPFSLDQKLPDLDAYLPAHRKVVEIRLLAVEVSYRKQAVFTRLTGLLARHFRAQGCDLAIISGTVRELRLYAHLGFSPFGPRVGSGDAIYQPMVLTLDAFKRRAGTLLSQGGGRAMSFLPGPVELRPSVSRAAADATHRILYHRGPDVAAMLMRVKSKLTGLAGAKHVEIMAGSGTMANDAVAAQLSCLPGPGLVLANGEFGARLVDHARRWGLEFRAVSIPWGEAFVSERIEIEVASLSPRWVWATACETSTGVAMPVPALSDICRSHGIDLCLDVVSALGLRAIDLASVRLASASSGKALGALSGLAMVFHDGRLASPGTVPRSLDLAAYRDAGGIPYTLPGHLLAALDAALADINWPERYQAIAEASDSLRQALIRLGCSMVAESADAMPGILTVAMPPDVPAARIAALMQRQGYLLACQSHYLAERNWLQICLMGSWLDDVLQLLPVQLGKLLPSRDNPHAFQC